MSSACATRLQLALDRAIAWRRRELVAAYLAAPSDEVAARVYFRQALLLLYAHMEGFVKSAATQYVYVIAETGTPTEHLCEALLGMALKSSVARAKDSGSLRALGRLFIDAMATPPVIAKLRHTNVIKTGSNLTSKRLRAIIESIGLDSARYSLIEHDVIDRLVKWRNGIAHGEGIPVDRADYALMHHNVIDFLDDIKQYLEDSAAADAYLTVIKRNSSKY